MAKVNATVKVNVRTHKGRCLLAEIRGLEEGMLLRGVYDTENKAFDFKWQGQDAVLWVGDNATLEVKPAHKKRIYTVHCTLSNGEVERHKFVTKAAAVKCARRENATLLFESVTISCLTIED